MRSRVAAFFRNWFGRRAAEESLDEEIRSCLEILIVQKIAAGSDPQQARRAALIELGGVEPLKEKVREVKAGHVLATFWRDVRFGLRALRLNPGFSVVAILTLALGIGANSAVFSVINGVLLQPLPYPESDRLVRIYQQNSPTNRFSLSVVDFQALQELQNSFESVGGLARSRGIVTGSGRPEWVRVARVSPGFFETMGVLPAVGRSFLDGEGAAGGESVVVVSHSFSRNHFGEAATALGQTLTLDGTASRVIGVMPPGVRELAGVEADLWPVLQLSTPARRGPFFLLAIGRLRTGVSLDDCRLDLADVSRRVFPIWEDTFQDETARLTPVSLREATVGDVGTALLLVFAAVMLVLLIAVTNVVNLVLARASRREREMALRSALGAGKGRLARQLVAEGVVLGGLGGLAGRLLAGAGVRALVTLMGDLPRLQEVGLDLTVVGFTSLIAVMSGVCFGIAPLLFSVRSDLATSLKGDDRGVSAGGSAQIFRNLLVAAEFALAVPLLVAAGLLLTSLWNLQTVSPGFDASNLVTARLELPSASYPDDLSIQRFWNEALREIEGLPGVLDAGISSGVPPDEPGVTNNFDLVDKPVEPGARQPIAPWLIVTSGFFDALGLPLVEGRWFDSRDHGESSPVAIVSRSWAEHFYPGESAVGRRLVSGGCTSCEPTTVVGVVGDLKLQGLDGGGQAVFIPFGQVAWRWMTLVARVEGASSSGIRLLIDKLQEQDPNLPLAQTATMQERLSASVSKPRHWTLLLGLFAGVAALLAAIGVFGVLSYFVSRQGREMGIRMALGANRNDLVLLVVRRGMVLAVAGLLAGLAISIYVTRWMQTLLFQVDPADAVVLAGVCLLLLLVALAGCYLPGRRAALVDPRQALMSE